MKQLKILITLVTLTLNLSADSFEKQIFQGGIWEHLNPHLHAYHAMGDTSTEASTLAAGAHDPSREDGTLQAIEFGASLDYDHLQGFITYNTSYGASQEWEGGIEEGFIKLVELPADFEVRGGKMLGRFGAQNTQHIHAWAEVDRPIVLSQFLGEDGLNIKGVDITGFLPTEEIIGATVGFGRYQTHEEESHGEEEEEHEEESHAIEFKRNLASLRFFLHHNPNDFNKWELGASYLEGKNSLDRRTRVYGLDATYKWRENGLEVDGKAFTLQNELLWRTIKTNGTFEDNNIDNKQDQWGFYSSALYTHNTNWDGGARVEQVSDIKDLEIEKRTRLSPHLTYYPLKSHLLSIRLQYNHDILEDRSENGIWLQFGFSFSAGPEVR